MYASQKRLLKLLGIVVAALVVLLVIVSAVQKHNDAKKQEAASAEAASTVTESDVSYTTLVYSNGTATLSFATDEDGSWYWADGADFPLDQNYILKIINTITGLHPQQTITGGDALEDYGLADPAMTLTATAEDGETLTLNLGDQVTGSSGSYYLYIAGAEDTVYVVSDTLASQLSVGIYDMMELPELPTIAEENFDSITVRGAAETVLTAYVNRSAAESDSSGEDDVAVTWRSGGADVTDSAQSLVSALSAMTLSGCEDYQPSAEAASICGFDAPAATVVVKYTDDAGQEQTLSLSVGTTTVSGDGYYVRINDDSTIYSMTGDSLSAVLAAASDGIGA